MTKHTRRVLLVPLTALLLLGSAAIPAGSEAVARTACAGTVNSSLGSGTLISGYCPVQVECCSFGAFDFAVFNCELCECGYLLTGDNGSYYFTRNTQWSCWLF